LAPPQNSATVPPCEAEETGGIVVQGDQLTDPEHLVQLRDIGEYETFVVIPRELLTRFVPKE
jgi:hypothetical protein